MLFHPDRIDHIVCAKATLYPTNDYTIVDGEDVIPFYMKVKIQKYAEGYDSLRLPIPLKGDLKDSMKKCLKDVVGTFVQWPVMRMAPISKVHVTLNYTFLVFM